MLDNDIDKISMFIKNNEHSKLSIEYFGGEPLLNSKWILKFQNLHRNPIASITTNAYLLNRTLFLDLLKAGLRSFQVTLDGLPEDHNMLRPTYNKKATWNTIIKNIYDAHTTSESFYFIIRVNFNGYTATPEKRARFLQCLNFIRKDNRFRLIFRPIGMYSDANDTTTFETKNVACLEKHTSLAYIYEKEAQEAGFLLGDISLLTTVGGAICYASKEKTFAISGNGTIMKCTVATDQNFNQFGQYTLNKYNSHKLLDWKKNLNFDKACTECFFFFQCMGKSCALKNFSRSGKACPELIKTENLLVEKIIRQKQNLKERQRNDSSI